MFFILQLVAAVSFSADNFIIARILWCRRCYRLFYPAANVRSHRDHRHHAHDASLASLCRGHLSRRYALGSSHPFTNPSGRVRIHHPGFGSTAPVLEQAASLVGRPRHSSVFRVDAGPGCLGRTSNCGNTLAMFLNGAGIIKFQVVVAAMFGIGCLLTKIVFTHLYGIAGVPWATTITYIFLAAIPYAWYVPRVMKQMKLQTASFYAVASSMVDG